MQAHQPQGGGAKNTTDPFAYSDAKGRFEVPTQVLIDRLNSYTSNRVAWAAAERLQLLGTQLAEAQRIAAQCMWVSVSERLPTCDHECTTDHLMVSDTVLVTDAGCPQSLGTAHLMDTGEWKVYQGEHDFMNPENITHWMPMPSSPTKQAQGGAE